MGKILNKDEYYMQKALGLAKKGAGRSHPNPMVGCVIVKANRIIAKAYHVYDNIFHAEAKAISGARESLGGSTLYVNLEPCSSFGRTPPCVGAILNVGIRRVVVGAVDPDPRHRGRGLRALKRKGVKVDVGVLKKECEELNEAFIKVMTKKLPFVMLKSAESLDGKIATRTGDAKWITSIESRKMAHRMRGEADGIIVGANTVIRDNPLLTVRHVSPGGFPARIIVDGSGRVMRRYKTLKIFRGLKDKTKPSRVIVFTRKKNLGASYAKALRDKGAIIEAVPTGLGGKLSAKSVLKRLKDYGIYKVLLEGGGELNASFIEGGLVDKCCFFISPCFIGGADAVSSVEGIGVKKVKSAYRLKDVVVKRLGNDILVEGYL